MDSVNATFNDLLQSYIADVEAGLKRYVPSADTRPQRLHAAMHHSLNAGGKRIRPVMVLAAQAAHPGKHNPLPAAVAVECIHTYSLIHDDLPAMDDSPLRRGQPSCHIAFDEATAILAGDALLTHAFALLADAYRSEPLVAARLVSILATAAGSQHLVGGQMADIEGESCEVDAEGLDFIHLNKTAALITAAMQMGALLGSGGEAAYAAAGKAGRAIGLTFQIVDDILDATSTTEAMGKGVGQDDANAKNTYVKIHGIEASRKRASELTRKAEQALEALGGNNRFLVELTHMLERRIH